jgi:hypothetical protein
MPEPIIQDRVVEIHELKSGDYVRATLTDHALYNRLISTVTNQNEGTVQSTHRVNDSWVCLLDLEGEVTSRRIGENWTFELLLKAPGGKR